ncbi:MAG: arsenate reductase (glutaredoxin) [Pirellulaceae bacterium]|jgi:arsenate reductase|nr:arsenate reductase (glutaredoxin) [Pirellulaceae bacterium]MDP7014367.1 arsenate reductase (glutaredoxin) [Pirellulaceae bacterium]
MAQVTIYHNPRCSKSRQTLALLEEQGADISIVEYLQDPLDAAEIGELLKQLGVGAAELIRQKEHAALGLPATADEAELIERMAANPQIIERPIVVHRGRARLGRPPEKVLEIL